MSYEADVAQVAESLAQLLASGNTLPPGELPAVNAARLGVRRLCARVLGDAAPVLPVRVGDGRPDIADLARSPIATLRGLLAKDPPELVAAGDHRPAKDAAAPSVWRTLWAATALAADGWSRADRASRPAGAQAWSTVADIAAVAEAAALVDCDLADPRRGALRVHRSDDSWRVGIAAAEVRRLANTGPLPPAEPLRPDGKSLLPLRVRSLADLPAALTRLAQLVRVAGHLRPESVGALAAAHARTLVLVAQIMDRDLAGGATHGGVMPRLSDALRAHAVALVHARGALHRMRSISADDPRPARQMVQVRTTLRAIGDRLRGERAEPARRVLIEVVRPALALAPAVRDLAEWQVSCGHWYARAEGRGRFEWTPTGAGFEPPAIDAVRTAAADAARLMARLPAVSPAADAGRSARGVLDPVLLGHHRRRHSSPADEPGAATVTQVR
jgi:hypothetical protein